MNDPDETGKRLSRRRFLSQAPAAVASTAMIGSATGPAMAAKKAYNILFVFTDQERHALPRPPGLTLPGHDRLRRTGVAFENHYAGAVMCSSSRSILVTGLQTADTRIIENLNADWVPDLSTSLPTYGHMLRKAGYYTAYKGKWHLTREFEQPKSFVGAMEKYGFSDYSTPGDVVGHLLGGYQFDETIASSAITWMRKTGRPLNNKGTPWCLTVSLVNPHDIMFFDTDLPGQPVQQNGNQVAKAAPAPRHSAYAPTWDVPLPKSLTQPFDQPGRPGAHGEYQRSWDILLGRIPPDPARWQRYTDFYINSIRAADANVLRLLNELDALGIADRTIVVFTSDHGEMSGAHGLRNKGPFAYEENTHVPFYVVHPDRPGGKATRALTSHIDVVPTLLTLAGASPEEARRYAGRRLPGKDLSALLDRPEAAGTHAVRDTVFFTYSGLVFNDSAFLAAVVKARQTKKAGGKAVMPDIRADLTKRGTIRMVFDGRYKFSRYFAPTHRNSPQGLDQLYAENDVELLDVRKDPHEMTNLAAKKGGNADLVMSMSAKLEHAISDEIGSDDGREMPDFKGIKWTVGRFD